VNPPAATYRLQFNPGFRFVDGRDLVPYLSDLGITDLYSSPRYKARRGSSHGYDIANPLRINSELGTEEDFDDLSEKLRHYDMGLVLDTVPNHMAASYENPWWTDVLENGQASAFASYFDIDWHPATTKASFLQENRVLFPILGDLYGNVLDNGEFALKIEDTGMYVRYYDTRLPLDPKSYSMILRRAAETAPQLTEIADLIAEIGRLPIRDDPSSERIMQRRRDKERIKEALWRIYQSDPAAKSAVDDALQQVGGSADALDELLSQQAYRLAYWKIGYEEINYRRFFDINELVALRIERTDVFERRNQGTLGLVLNGKVSGLRMDHIDGLWDPLCFLRRVRSSSENPDLYIVVEKILGRDEALPPDWPVQGTTGYEFLNTVNGIFVQPEGFQRLEEAYSRRTGSYLPFAELCYASTKLVMQSLFTGDVNALAHHLGALAARHRQARDIRMSELNDALVEVTACLPVYRTYIHEFAISPEDRRVIARTIALARRRTSREEVSDPAFEFLRSVLLLDPPSYLEERKQEWLDFVMRWQQFTGPVMAKGLEDTTCYRHNSLISLNEVGADPLRERPPATLDEFHRFNAARRERWPDTMNATATHDTKRGEDVRARINVLSEIPEEWDRRLGQWMDWNAGKKVKVSGALAPGTSEEILLYETMLGAWPNRAEEEAAFRDRLKEFVVKALREAKQSSSWIVPHEEYERAVQEFVDRILVDGTPFFSDLREFQQRLAAAGARNSLSQLVLKIASPGVPDFYQGTELWNLTLVDPDNRRLVDYKRRAGLLETLRRREAEDRIALIRDLAANPLQDEMKLFVTYRGLEFRKSQRELFARGDYLPLETRGTRAANVVAFARSLGDRWAIVAAPRWMSGLADWADTEIVLPPEAPREWRDVLTGLIPAGWRMSDLVKEFPVALLAAG
jgi:(1->4)-alpha-D-glucan 1-alpha-D-glucosylmutase